MSTNKIQLVVSELAKRNLFAVVVPTADPHNSEYVAPCFQRRAKLCGFTGSMGTCVVTADAEALLWTDGRYWLEAEQTLDKGWTLMKMGDGKTPPIEEWLQSAVAAQSLKGKPTKVGIDPATQLWSGWKLFLESGLDIAATESNVIDAVLNENGAAAVPPVLPAEVDVLGEQYVGKSVADKLSGVAGVLRDMKADVTLLSDLSEVAWLLNLRNMKCSDIPFAPTFFGFAVVASNGTAAVFLEKAKLTDAAAKQLAGVEGLELHPYAALPQWFAAAREKNAAMFSAFGGSAVISESTASFECYRLLSEVAKLRVRGGVKAGIVEKLKAVKNQVELAGIRESHIRDGVSLTRFLAWMFHKVNGGKEAEGKLTEAAAADQLLKFRAEGGQGRFLGASFGTISAAGGNAAIVHYRYDAENSAVVKPTDMFLLDSGGQYLDGTTDVTRTVVFSRPGPPAGKAHWAYAYTLVLKGHIRLNTTVFPSGTTGHALDALARLDLWKHGLTYRHGTGHGVGHCLNVHEGPHSIAMLPRASDPGLSAGCIVSNEPGFYVANEFGIRIENLDVVIAAPRDGPEMFGFDSLPVCRLDSLTMAPLCRSLIDRSLLSADEISWINAYHQKVYTNLAPRVREFPDAESVLKFLDYECAPF